MCKRSTLNAHTWASSLMNQLLSSPPYSTCCVSQRLQLTKDPEVISHAREPSVAFWTMGVYSTAWSSTEKRQLKVSVCNALVFTSIPVSFPPICNSCHPQTGRQAACLWSACDKETKRSHKRTSSERRPSEKPDQSTSPIQPADRSQHIGSYTSAVTNSYSTSIHTPPPHITFIQGQFNRSFKQLILTQNLWNKLYIEAAHWYSSINCQERDRCKQLQTELGTTLKVLI